MTRGGAAARRANGRPWLLFLAALTLSAWRRGHVLRGALWVVSVVVVAGQLAPAEPMPVARTALAWPSFDAGVPGVSGTVEQLVVTRHEGGAVGGARQVPVLVIEVRGVAPSPPGGASDRGHSMRGADHGAQATPPGWQRDR